MKPVRITGRELDDRHVSHAHPRAIGPDGRFEVHARMGTMLLGIGRGASLSEAVESLRASMRIHQDYLRSQRVWPS